jgi:hypothetical protein
VAVIAKVTAAKKIFLSNGGVDKGFTHFIPGGPDVSYNELYAALKQWGYFQLVDSPAQADLIFDIRSTVDMHTEFVYSLNPDKVGHDETGYIPILTLSISDASTHAPIYSIVIDAGRGSNIPKGKIAFAKSITALTDKVKALVAAPAPTQNP